MAYSAGWLLACMCAAPAGGVSHLAQGGLMRTVRSDTRYDCAMNGAASERSFGELLVQGRTAKAWSQDRLAAESGISRTTISRYEREITSSPEAEHVRALCAALDIDPRQA